MTIRRATDEDETEIEALDLVWATVPFRDGCTWWVVDEDPEEGYAGAYIDGDEVHLERAFVGAHRRGSGLQRALIRVREAWARRQGCTRATTYTASDNVPSMRALARAGYLPSRPRSKEPGGWIRWDKDLARRSRT